MNRIYRVIWNCTLQVFQACSELTRRVGKTSTVNLRKSSGLTTKFSRLTLGVLLALSGSVSGASLEVDNGQITNIDTDVAYDAYLVGWYGTGVLNILAGGNASLTTITTSVIGGNEDSEGTVNVLGGTWRLYDSGNNARPLNVGQSGTGTLNIKQKGHVDGGYLRLGTQAAGVGTVNVEGEDSVLTTELFEIGSYGTGSLNGTLNVEGGEVYLGVFEPAVGTLNIGAAHGEAAADAGFITNATKVEFGSGEGVFVFNHTNNSDAGYQVDMLITGDDKDGKVIHDAGHTVFNAGNTYSGKTLVVGASDYTWKGRNYQVNGTGDVLIGVPKPWNDPMANNPLTTLNLLEHDDNHVGVQLVKAQTVIGSGGSLTLRDLQGDEVEADKTLHIAQNGTVVAEGDYGFRLTTAPGDGLYVNYGLKALNIHGGQKLTLAEHGGAYGATADMSAKIGGEGDLAINTVRQVSLSNGQNDYQGATYVQMGTLRTDADGALGNTRELNISNAAIVDLNGSTQTVETFTGQMGSTVLFKEGSLTVNKGGISQGELTGGGNLNVTGGTLAVEGLNARYNALTSVSPNAEVSLDNTQGLGRGNIANDGLLTLKNVTGELRNSISGKGIVSATARTDVELDGDNSRFVGQFNIDTGSALSVNEQKNLGDASVINNGLLTISTERSWAMTHSISGSGDLTKLGTGILTLNNDSSAYQGTTDIVGGEIAFGSDSAINTASQHINIHNSGVMSGNVTTAGDVNVMSGGTLRVAKTTIGESAATWRMAARFK